MTTLWDYIGRRAVRDVSEQTRSYDVFGHERLAIPPPPPVPKDEALTSRPPVKPYRQEAAMQEVAQALAAKPNPKAAHGAAKVQMGLTPPVALVHMARAMEHGAAKYGAYNWRQDPVEVMTYVHAMYRHLAAFQDLQDVDADSGGSHLGHIMACCAILLDSLELHIAIDNRPPPGAAPEVLERFKRGA